MSSVLVFDGLWRKYILCTNGGEVGVEDTSLLADSGRKSTDDLGCERPDMGKSPAAGTEGRMGLVEWE